jgi:hypothetical protein
LGFFPDFEYLHLHHELYRGWDSSLKIKFTCISCTPYRHKLKIFFYNVHIIDLKWRHFCIIL